jgi:AhpD family alkylhydroperoxidase
MLIQVYDPAMCCSTGACGPSVDPALAQFAADLRWVESQGCSVERYNLAQQPQVFASNAIVKDRMASCGNDCLPLILVDGKIVSDGRYLSLEELAAIISDAEETPSRYSPAVAELVALGAAVVANCGDCFEHHWQAARRLGVSEEDIAKAVETAETVKRMPVRSMRELVKRHLGDKSRVKQIQAPAASSCCVPEVVTFDKPASKCC